MGDNSKESIAEYRLLVDIVENILPFSDNPVSCAGYLTTQIRDLIGVRIVAIIQSVTNESETSNNLIGICPSSEESSWDQPQIQDFISIASKFETPRMIDPSSDPAGRSLASIEIGKSFVVPLFVGSERVGMIILLDLMEPKETSIILETVHKISGVIALILKNSLLYKNMENTVEIRTLQLAERDKQFQAIFEQATVGVAQVNTSSGKFLKVNKKYCDIVGYSEDEMINMDFQSITHPDDLKTDINNMELLKSGKIREYNVEKRYIHKNGESIWVNLAISPMWNPDESPDYHITIVRDITQRKQAEENLRKEQQFLTAVFDSIEEGIVSCDENGIITRFNRTTRMFHGLPEEPIPADQWVQHYNLFLPDGKTPMQKEDVPMFRALYGEKVHDAEMVIISKHGHARTLVANGQNLKDSDGKIIGAVVAMHDITKHKLSEEEIRKLNEELEQRVKERTAELEKKNRDLEIMNRGFVLREQRVIELKKQIDKLEAEINAMKNEDKTKK